MAEKRVQRRLAAILTADVVGYSRLMREDEAGTLGRLKDCRTEVIDPSLARYDGRIVKVMGDGLLVEFASAVDAVQSALDVQTAMAKRNDGTPDALRMAFRVGVHLGEVIVDGDDIHGDGVNIATRLEGLSEAGAICVSDDIFRQVRGKVEAEFGDLGPQQVKNISEPIHAYAVRPASAQTAIIQTPLDTSSVADEAPPRTEQPSIAVLPFDNMSGDPEQEYFSDGISEDIITALSHVRELLVIARNTTFTFKGQAVDVQAVAKDLDVGYVLEGSVRRAGKKIRISAQLIDGATGNHVWAERYDRDLEDIFAVQDEITETVVGAVAPELHRAERERALHKPPESLDAWELYQRGLWHIYRVTREDTQEALALFEESARADPRFGPAHAGISFVHFNNVFLDHTEDHDRDITEAYEAARRAMACDEKDATAHWVLARAYYLRRELSGALAEFEAAIELNPSFAHGYYMIATIFMLNGRSDEAVLNIEKAMRLSPHDPLIFAMMGVRANSLLHLGELDEAAAWMERGMRQPNSHALAVANGAFNGALAGRDDMVETAMSNLRQLRPDYSIADFLNTLSFVKDEHRQMVIDGLRKAGLPD